MLEQLLKDYHFLSLTKWLFYMMKYEFCLSYNPDFAAPSKCLTEGEVCGIGSWNGVWSADFEWSGFFKNKIHVLRNALFIYLFIFLCFSSGKEKRSHKLIS